MVGTGPAGLMAASVITAAGHPVTLFEKRTGPGRKLLIAGSSGLNITHDLPRERFHELYSSPANDGHFERLFRHFGPQEWLEFIHRLGLKTFRGTSRRYFVEEMKASGLLRSWTHSLKAAGAEFLTEHELVDFEANLLRFQTGLELEVDAVCLALGAGSYVLPESPLRWPGIFIRKGVRFNEFRASNVGYEVSWPEGFLKEAEGLPLKGVALSTSKGSLRGDLVITRYGLEGTPIYFMGAPGSATLDLKPDLTAQQVLARLQAPRENLSPMRRIKRTLKLSAAAQSLLFHLAPSNPVAPPERASSSNRVAPLEHVAPSNRPDSLEKWASLIKAFPIRLEKPRPLEEAISSSGGIDWSELDSDLMLKRYPGIYLAGEMIDWDAPTGGFLIQACVSQGHLVGTRIVERLARAPITSGS